MKSAWNLLFLALMTLSTPCLAHGASLCEGLRDGQAQSLTTEGNTLAHAPQDSDQFTTTGCEEDGLFHDRPACHRTDIHGKRNGRFGSCATFTAFSTAVAITERLNLKLPPTFEYTPENIVRFYDLYGNPYDTKNPGYGSFTHVLGKILQEMESHLPRRSPEREKLRSFAESYQYLEIPAGERGRREAPSMQALLAAVAAHFNAEPEHLLLPVELIFDGWILDRPIEEYCPVRDSSGDCNQTQGRDQRFAHSALIVGRRRRGGQCEVQIRNSWRGCEPKGRYGQVDRDCDPRMDTVWISEDELVRGIAAARVRTEMDLAFVTAGRSESLTAGSRSEKQ